MPLHEIPILEQILEEHAGAIGKDLEGYRNHTRRVADFCLALATHPWCALPMFRL